MKGEERSKRRGRMARGSREKGAGNPSLVMSGGV